MLKLTERNELEREIDEVDSNVKSDAAKEYLKERGVACGKSILKVSSAIVSIFMAVDFGYIGFGGRRNDFILCFDKIRTLTLAFFWLCMLILGTHFLKDVVSKRGRNLNLSRGNVSKLKRRAFYIVLSLAWAIVATFGQISCMLCLYLTNVMDSPGIWIALKFWLILFQLGQLSAVSLENASICLQIVDTLKSSTDRQLRVMSVPYILLQDGFASMPNSERHRYPLI